MTVTSLYDICFDREGASLLLFIVVYRLFFALIIVNNLIPDHLALITIGVVV